MAWTDTLGNSQIKALAVQAVADNVVSYQEMFTLLDTATSGGISATDYDDLKAVYTNCAALFASDYVKSISYSVIYTNPANAKWWSGAQQISDVAPLGNMSAGMSELNADRLVAKWFLGTDLPMPVVGGDTANSKASSGVFDYATATGPLFVSGAAPSDINQGNAGDCYLVASLGAIADVDPSLIVSAFIDNGNGTYGVRFYLNGAPVYVTVNQSVAVKANGQVAVASNTAHSLSGESWVTLFEKAYVQLNAQANINNADNWAGEASYQALEGGWANPIRQVANLGYTYYSAYYTGVPDDFKTAEHTSTNPLTYRQTIIDALNQGAVGWLGSFGNSYDAGNGKQNLVAGHAFMILGYDAGTDKFTIRNPWGGAGSSYNVEFKASLGDFWNSTVKGIVAISDPVTVAPTFNYSLASSTTNASPVIEGQAVTFTITRSATGAASTVYVSTSPDTAGAGDYAGIDKVAVDFAAYETTRTVKINTYVDNLNEGTESFRLDLFKAATDAASVGSATGHIKDAAAASYVYTITSSAGTAGGAVTEGGQVVFTVTRSGSGSASTVYLSTSAGTAVAGDIQGLDKSPLTFAAYETTKTVTVAALQDSVSEGTESFHLDLYENLATTTKSASTSAFIKDAALPYYGYTVKSSAGSPADGILEGGAVTFTITRSGSGTKSEVFVATAPGTASNADYSQLALQSVSFSANQTVATVTVQTNEDWWLETDEFFTLDLYLNATDGFHATYGTAFIKDKPKLDYNYTITNSSEGTPTVEGTAITFTITRDGSGTASTVYLGTAPGTADGSDYQSLERQALTFAAYETTKTITISAFTDSLIEGTEYFWLNLYRNLSDSGYSAFSKASIQDAVAADYSYTITSSAPDGSPASEGGTVTFTITRSGSGTASTVYLSTTPGTADGSDYEAFDKVAVTFAAYETTKTVTVSTFTDGVSEGVEYFWLDLFKNYGDSTYSAFSSADIADAAVSTYSYAVTSSASFESPLTEGGTITFTITRSGSGTASTVYVGTEAGTASAGGGDYAGIAGIAVNFAAYETSKTVTVATYTDGVTEGTEYFWLNLYQSYADAVDFNWFGYASAYIADAVTANYSYTVTSSAPSGAPVTEGGTINFTITRSGSGSASTVYLSTSPGTAGNSDYQAIDKLALTFAANETSKTVTVATYTDGITEGEEYFWLDLYKNYSDSSYSTYGSGSIADAAVANYTYTVASNAPVTAPVGEGGTITLTITRSGSGTASTVYVSTPNGSAGDSDYQGVFAEAVTFGANETTKTIAVATYTDGIAESTEYFWFDLYRTYADALDVNWFDYTSAYIADVAVASYSYGVTSSATSGSPVVEGGTITFTITRSGSGTASTVYVGTEAGTATSDEGDYQELTGIAVNFAANETTRTVTVSTYADGVVEGAEYFWLNLYKTYADALTLDWFDYATAYVADSAVGGYVYTVTSSAPQGSPVIEGGGITFTIVRSGTGSASTIYVGTQAGTASAGAGDYSGLTGLAVTFAANETTKTVTIGTFADGHFEGSEHFWLNLYESQADAQAFNWFDYATAYIIDSAGSVGGTIDNAIPAVGAPPDMDPGVKVGSPAVSVTSFPGHSTGAFGNDFAFAAVTGDGSVVAWGNAQNGGDSSAVAGQLHDVIEVASNSFAFAALRRDGSVVTWGNQNLGGNSGPVASALDGRVDVIGLFSTATAFAALRGDGSVVTWGDPGNGGDSVAVAGKLGGGIDVTGIFSSLSAFAAVRADGSVVTWGFPILGGDSSAVATQLDGTVDVMSIAATGSAFAALRADGSVVSWGNANDGGNSGAVASALNGTVDVLGVASTTSAFAAVRADGSVVTWGDPNNGGNSTLVASGLDGALDVVAIASTNTAFAARRVDGSVVTWGDAGGGGSSEVVAAGLDGTIEVKKIYANSSAFAALRADGSVVTWGYGSYGGDHSAVEAELHDVVSIAATDHAFAALKSDGSVVTWGGFLGGGNDTDVQAKLDGTIDVVQLYATSVAFAALRADGSVVTWGDQQFGGDSTVVAPRLTSVAQIADSNPVEDAIVPVATHDDAFIVLQGKSLTLAASVLSNDDGATAATLVAGTGHGTVQLAADGMVSYAPAGGFAGTDSFSYQATNGSGAGEGQALLYVVPVQVGMSTTLDLLALDAEQQIASTYAAFFGRAADVAGFEFWVGQFVQNLPTQGAAALFANIASSFGISAEAKALYPFLVNPFGASDGEISAFLDSVYNNLFNRSSDAAGLAYWTGQIKQTLQAGQFVGSVLVNIMSGAQDTAAGQDITTLMGKVAVSLEYVHEQQAHDTIWAGASDIAAATALLDTVSAEPQSVLTGIRNAEVLIATHA
ncbi:MAG: Calx-beta domain-containing protein [Reyranella sp.]|uniref:Calx-beta domain-containing protein n=1 Tax=Reyranella sp. TaxID=1929291 RepID=UPI003D104DFF